MLSLTGPVARNLPWSVASLGWVTLYFLLKNLVTLF